MKREYLAFYLSIVLVLCVLTGFADKKPKPFTATSPDGKLEIKMILGEHLGFVVTDQGKQLATFSNIGLTLAEYPEAYKNPELKTLTSTPFKFTIKPVVAEKRSLIPDEYTEVEVWFKGKVGVKFRAYNDGVAYRLMTRFPDSLTIVRETFQLSMDKADSVYFGEENNFISHSERQYPCLSAAAIKENQMCVLPAVFRKSWNTLVAFSEADLLDYPGLYLKGNGSESAMFSALSPQVAKDEYISSDKRSYIVGERYPYIARTSGTHEFPWRVLGVARTDAQLLENDIIYRLGSPCKLQETSWIKPGKVAWDWWNAWNLSGVPFTSGINTETYKYYIDFASRYGLEYIIMDEGWSANDDLDKINPDLDMEALFNYAGTKNVKIILWVTGKALEDKFDASLDKFAKWGVAGIKVDFLIRDDQEMVRYYERVAAAAAKRHMLVDFHGSFKPTGLSRTYPNALTREGVQGSENNKWSKLITPKHDCTLPFTRMFAGPMDYTPGAMTNATEENFTPRWTEPMSMGTRSHELAKFILFESPLQMLCDAPSKYLKEPVAMEFLASVPTTWDETHAIDASVGKYLVVDRKKGDVWYLGAMTDWTARDLKVRLDFLPENETYLLESWSDGPNADKKAEDCLFRTEEVNHKTTITLHLAAGGGYAARLRKK